MTDLKLALRNALNRCLSEGESNTPDFILAAFLVGALDAYNKATNDRASWYGRMDEPGKVSMEDERSVLAKIDKEMHGDLAAEAPAMCDLVGQWKNERRLLRAAYNALKSYELGNGSTELAESVTKEIDKAKPWP